MREYLTDGRVLRAQFGMAGVVAVVADDDCRRVWGVEREETGEKN